MFTIITIAAKVTDRPLRFHNWRVIRGRTCRKGQTEQVTWYWPTRYSMPYMSYLVWSWGSRGSRSLLSMTGFWRGSLLSCLWLWSRFQSVHSRVQFLSTAKASPGLSGAWLAVAGRVPAPTAPNSRKPSMVFLYFVLFLLILLILLVL